MESLEHCPKHARNQPVLISDWGPTAEASRSAKNALGRNLRRTLGDTWLVRREGFGIRAKIITKSLDGRVNKNPVKLA